MVAQGGGTCVCITGDAGTGKSRLISEFKKASAQLDLIFQQISQQEEQAGTDEEEEAAGPCPSDGRYGASS